MNSFKKILCSVCVLSLLSSVMVGCSVTPSDTETPTINTTIPVTSAPTTEPTTVPTAAPVISNDPNKGKKTFALGETLYFDDLEITFGSNVQFVTVENEFSDYYEKDVVKIPVTIKNVGKEENNLNIFYFTQYGSKETTIDSVSTYFDDGVGLLAGQLQPNASYDKSFYFPYDGDGNYSISFSNFTTKLTASFPVVIGENSIENKKSEYGVGETFRYHFMEITLGEVSLTTVSNRFSSYYGKDIIRIPLTIKNIANDPQHLNSFSCSIFSPAGIEVDTADTYFDDSVGWGAKDLATNASYTRAFYAVYEGSGTYKINFGSYKTIVSATFDVNKAD